MENKKEGKLTKFLNKLMGVDKFMALDIRGKREYMRKVNNVFFGMFLALGLFQFTFAVFDLLTKDWFGAMTNFIIAFWIFMYGESIVNREEGWDLAHKLIADWDEFLDKIKKTFDELIDSNEKLLKENKKLKEELKKLKSVKKK